jgi:uncharacterized protein (DUF1778 family)
MRLPGSNIFELTCTAICRTLEAVEEEVAMLTTDNDAPGKAPRLERLEARISKAQKALFVRAATVQGRSLTDFLIASMQEAAERALRAYDMLTLSERDRKSFVTAIVKPATAGKTLRQAAKLYKERMGI